MLGGVNSLNSDNRVRILGVIDKLRELGVSENVSLPQLVVVGDQSSGKSSLLEAITGLSFPIASDLCTRFATQIVLCRATRTEAEVKITIIPGPTAQMDDEAKERLLGFERKLATDEFGPPEFARIFDEAAECMGVPGPSTENLENLEKRFSDDILKIELSGPDQRHLSVVDVPGLFHNPTKFQTAEDRTIIRKLIETYITDKRTIILAVMDARNNLANQEVFSMARAADPQGARTVGVITKCDALEAGDEEGVLRIAKNEVERLKHGWFAVKNRSTKEIREGVTIKERHAHEKQFFASNPWTELARDRVGIENVTRFLGGLLYDHIRGEFPYMVKEIEGLAQKTQSELELLGPSRQTPAEQRSVLLRIALRYRHDVAGALNGNYSEDLAANRTLKLRLNIRELNEGFAKIMSLAGHTKAFRTVENKIDKEYYQSSGDDENIYDWIRRIYRDSRGVELPGTINPIILGNMFREQSTRWQKYSFSYFQSVSRAILAFNDELFQLIVGDEDMRTNLRAHLEHDTVTAFRRAKEQLEQILHDEREGILQTVNHYFAETLDSIRQERFLARLKAAGISDSQGSHSASLNSLMGTLHLSNEDQAVHDIHDILKAYYKLALKRFTDNVVLQVSERHLLGTNGPVNILAPELIGGFSDGELADIASENFATSSVRTDLQSRIDRLHQALDIAHSAGS